jgi:O-antigen ligase
MLSKSVEKVIAKWLYIGVPVVSLLVSSFVNYDPVNVGKMVVTVGIGFSIWALVLKGNVSTLWREQKPVSIAVGLFILAGLTASLASAAPIEQNLYGVFGRNTGFVTYLGLTGILIGASLLKSLNYFQKISQGLIVAGLVNVFVCGLELTGFNIFGFNNIYGHILGTFGNPNFISSFLGIFIAAFLAYVVSPGVSKWMRFASPVVIALAFYEILDSKSIQGIVVTVLGFGIVGFFLVKSYLKKSIYQLGYLALSAIAGAFGLAGALQIGPLTQYIYKRSVSLRGEYWRAGIKMGTDHPFTGVGFDTYGDNYRLTRSANAMITPGPGTVTNSAHNVNIDIFAYGGFPLIISYLALLLIAVVAIFKVIKRTTTYDKYFYPIATAWVCYQAQAMISINQIGLAVWGWVLTGAVIGYERCTRNLGTEAEQNSNTKKKVSTTDQSTSTYLTSVIGLTLGLAISFPPFIADSAWRSAMKSAKIENVQKAATQWPMDSYRLANVAILFEQNKFPQQAYDITKKLNAFNPGYFDGWKLLAGISLPTAQEKADATKKMHQLDPRNLELK